MYSWEYCQHRDAKLISLALKAASFSKSTVKNIEQGKNVVASEAVYQRCSEIETPKIRELHPWYYRFSLKEVVVDVYRQTC